MPAIIEQATANPIPATPLTTTLPTVAYDIFGKLIIATVIISRSNTPDEYIAQIPPVSVPGPTGATWTVLWNLVPIDGLTAIFGPEGVYPDTKKRPVPKNIVFFGAVTLQPPTQCLAEITNNVVAVEFFDYDLDISVSANGIPLNRRTRSSAHSEVVIDIIDPTIAVVPDPIT
jgi:hypothetical protein